jgi:hypothetical protein
LNNVSSHILIPTVGNVLTPMEAILEHASNPKPTPQVVHENVETYQINNHGVMNFWNKT